mgnify:CR=1 FL=1
MVNNKIYQATEAKYRHEYKYIITEQQLALLQQRLDNLMPRDPHVGESGFYNIRSLYFDDYYNRCYYENLNGSDPREKFRIRIYNKSPSRITLECKRKERGKTLKTSCPLTADQCEKLMIGKVIPDVANQLPLLRKLTLEMMIHHMHPVVIVGYDRIPYMYEMGNVRVTLDTKLYSSTDLLQFLDGNIKQRPVMPKGFHLLEVKWDEYIPDVIYRACQLDNLSQTDYSKYFLCRQYYM